MDSRHAWSLFGAYIARQLRSADVSSCHMIFGFLVIFQLPFFNIGLNPIWEVLVFSLIAIESKSSKFSEGQLSFCVSSNNVSFQALFLTCFPFSLLYKYSTLVRTC